jgi:hypothetical protein
VAVVAVPVIQDQIMHQVVVLVVVVVVGRIHQIILAQLAHLVKVLLGERVQ